MIWWLPPKIFVCNFCFVGLPKTFSNHFLRLGKISVAMQNLDEHISMKSRRTLFTLTEYVFVQPVWKSIEINCEWIVSEKTTDCVKPRLEIISADPVQPRRISCVRCPCNVVWQPALLKQAYWPRGSFCFMEKSFVLTRNGWDDDGCVYTELQHLNFDTIRCPLYCANFNRLSISPSEPTSPEVVATVGNPPQIESTN